MKKQIHQQIYIWSIVLLLVSLPFSKFLISVAQFIILINWFVEGEVINKFKCFFKNKVAVVFASVFLLHLIGLLYTSDIDAGIKDIRIKLPLIFFPVVFSSIPQFTSKQYYLFVKSFILAVLISTIISFVIYLGFTNLQIEDIRDISIFSSHIRLSLMICLSVFFILYRVVTHWYTLKIDKIIALSLLICWFVYFLFIIESATGIGILVFSIPIIIFIFWMKGRLKSPKLFFAFAFLILFVPLAYVLIQLQIFYSEKKSAIDIPKKTTAKGNVYSHYFNRNQIENRTYVWRNICEKELEESWNRRSKFVYSGKDLKGQELSSTLIRFLSSKGLDKDYEGVNKLSDFEIHGIEHGISNYKYLQQGMRTRINQIIWEIDQYINSENPSGHSVTSRFEFWRASLIIINENIIYGVGTGDLKPAFSKAYQKIGTLLDKDKQLYSHNEYLRIGVMFGLVGIVIFLFSILYPFILRKPLHFYYYAFILIILLSMITEDTLETQTGVTFYALFNMLLLTFPDEI